MVKMQREIGDSIMPRRRVHSFFDEAVLGRPFPRVHRAIDLPYLFLGRKHRKFFHDPLEAYLMGVLASDDSRGGFSGLLHVKLDEECSKNPALRKQLERLAKLKKQQDREFRRWKKEMLRIRKRREAQERKRSAASRKRLNRLMRKLLDTPRWCSKPY